MGVAQHDTSREPRHPLSDHQRSLARSSGRRPLEGYFALFATLTWHRPDLSKPPGAAVCATPLAAGRSMVDVAQNRRARNVRHVAGSPGGFDRIGAAYGRNTDPPFERRRARSHAAVPAATTTPPPAIVGLATGAATIGAIRTARVAFT